MPNFALTLDAPITQLTEPGFQRAYQASEIASRLNPVPDGVSNLTFWTDHFHRALMLRPAQLEEDWLNNQAASLGYVYRVATDWVTNPANAAAKLIFEAPYLQNPNNPWIFFSTGSGFIDSPEQTPNLVGVSNQAPEPYYFPPPGAPGEFPGTPLPDFKVLCWTKAALPANIPLYLRWHMTAFGTGRKTVFQFRIGQFLLLLGPAGIVVFRDDSANGSWSPLRMVYNAPLFSDQLSGVDYFGAIPQMISRETQGEDRGLLWLPYAKNHIYLQTSAGTYGTFKSSSVPQSNGLTGAQADWKIVESRPLVVAALVPAASHFQVQQVKFADGPGVLQLDPFVTDYTPVAAPAASWASPDQYTPHGSSITYSVPSTSATYPVPKNPVDDDGPTITTFPSDQTRTYYTTATFLPGTDAGGRKSFTPELYSYQIIIPFTTGTWPVARTDILDVAAASPSARLKSASFVVTRSEPGTGDFMVDDLGASLATIYDRSYYPIQFADQNGDPSHPANWIKLWNGIADPADIRELRLDTHAVREFRVRGQDYWRYLNETICQDNRVWNGFGHIYVLQNLLQQAGLSISGWDGPPAGTVDGNGKFVQPTGNVDVQLGGLNISDPGDAGNTNSEQPTGGAIWRPAWTPQRVPPDSYGSFIKRVADYFAGWEFGFNADGTPYYFRYDFYQTSELTFYKNRSEVRTSGAHSGSPTYYLGTVRRVPIECDANVVQVVCSSTRPSLIASTPFVDAASLSSPTAPNFIGHRKYLRIAIPGYISHKELNACARRIFDRARRRRVTISFKADHAPTLKIGHCFTLEGIAGTWRLISAAATYERPGYNYATMVGELVEQGYA